MFDTPVQFSRPLRVPDGSGGCVATFDPDNAQTVWIDVVMDDQEHSIAFHAESLLRTADIIAAPFSLFSGDASDTRIQYYQVGTVGAAPCRPWRSATLTPLHRGVA